MGSPLHGMGSPGCTYGGLLRGHVGMQSMLAVIKVLEVGVVVVVVAVAVVVVVIVSIEA